MAVRQECPGCGTVLLLPENGQGRCPRCQAIVQAAPSSMPPLGSIIPEIGAEHEAGPAEMRLRAQPPPLPAPEAPAPPRERPRRRRDAGPFIEIAKPFEKASKALPLTLLILGFVASIMISVGSAIYLIAQARQHRPAPIILPMPRR
jgi:hypothetical protein